MALVGGADKNFLDKGDNAWQLTASILVGLQSVPGLVMLYGGSMKRKWAVNSALMAFFGFAESLLVWFLWAYKAGFGNKLSPLWGRLGPILETGSLMGQANLPEANISPLFPMATIVLFQAMFGALTVVLVAGSLLGRMNFTAWALFVPLWLTFSYTVMCFSFWGGGFVTRWGVVDFAGGFVIHIAAGAAGPVAAYWVGPRTPADRESNSPSSIFAMLCGTGIIWLGWSGFNGGGPYAVNASASLAIINTHLCAATSICIWTLLDTLYRRPSATGMSMAAITGLVCITPAAGLVETWAALIFGFCSGVLPWCAVNLASWVPQSWAAVVDDPANSMCLHGLPGILGALLTGLFVTEDLCTAFGCFVAGTRGSFYGGSALVFKHLAACLLVIVWNVVVTSLICLLLRLVVRLRMTEAQLEGGDVAVHGEDLFAGDSWVTEVVELENGFPKAPCTCGAKAAKANPQVGVNS